MKNEKLFQRVEDLMHTAFIRNNKEFFSYAWRENVVNFHKTVTYSYEAQPALKVAEESAPYGN